MSKCQTKKLGDICDIQSGGTPSRSKNEYWVHGTIPWVKISDINSKFINKTEELITEFGLENSSAKIFTKGTIIYTIFATIGEVAILNCNACTNQAIAGIKILNNNVSTEYLYHYLVHKKEEVKALSRGVAQNNINLTLLRALEIDIPVASEQKMKSEVLNKVCSIIEARKIQLLELDKLAKSRFIEMFGRCSEDKFGWGLKTLEDCCVINPQKTTDSRLKPGLEVSFCPMPYISEKGEIKTDDIIIYDKVKSGFTYFAENDVLFAKITPCMENGKGAIARNLKNGIGFGSTEFHVLRPKKEMITPEWLYFLTTFQQFRKDAENNMTGSAGQRRVPANFLKKYRVSVPPKSLQYEFARILQQLDKSKFRIKKSLEKLELTYKALLQEYFG